MSGPRREVGYEELQELVLKLIAEEQGKPLSLMISKNLPMLPTETAWKIVEFVSQQRSSLFEDETGQPSHGKVMAFTEGILCGLRVRAAISTLDTGRDG